jgi:hypothetical protein
VRSRFFGRYVSELQDGVLQLNSLKRVKLLNGIENVLLLHP